MTRRLRVRPAFVAPDRARPVLKASFRPTDRSRGFRISVPQRIGALCTGRSSNVYPVPYVHTGPVRIGVLFLWTTSTKTLKTNMEIDTTGNKYGE
jgi:hypothetical protein